ncbi:MAG TPA: PA14 domain-containing protein [Verrucomicrobiae bacterium]|jgi:hypothetical protein
MKLLTGLLTGASCLALAVVAHAAPPAGFTTNSQATIVTNAIQWNLWGPGLSANGFTTTGADNTLNDLVPLHNGTADTVYGTRTASYYTNVLQGPNNNDPGSYWGGVETAVSQGYADEFLGVFIPPVTTNYVFFICSDDLSTLYLSTDISAANEQLIAQETAWSNPNQWTASGGASSLAQKRSDQFVAAGAPAAQYPNGIPLVAGNMYFIELDHENGNGGYNDSVYYKFAGAADPVSDGTVHSNLTNTPSSQILGYVAQPPSFVTVSLASTNVTAVAGGEASFSASIKTDATIDTNGLPFTYALQWQTNGVNVTNADGTAATGHNFSYIVSPGDNNTKVTCVANFPNSSVSTTYSSPAATLTVTPGTIATGALKREFWLNASGFSDLTSFNLGSPQYTTVVTNGEGPINTGINNYSEIYSGFFIPPTTGKYVFFVTSDDNSDLFISTDNTPDSKYLIAQETSYATNDEWTSDNAGTIADVASKRSDQFTPPNASAPPYADGIQLTAGQQYYIEADHYQGGGGDDFSMTYSLLADVGNITNGVPSAFNGTNLAFEAGPATTLTISESPQSVSLFQGDTATFQIGVATDSGIEPKYQWIINGTNVGSGAFTNKTSTLTLANLISAQSGSTIEAVVTIPFTTLAVTSTPVTLTVQTAVVAPGYLKVQFYPGQSVLPTTPAPLLGLPEYTSSINTFQSPVNDGINNYVRIVSGFFVAPETGNYVFNVCSDDQSDLYLSTDEKAVNLKLIAQETAWSNEQQWVDSAGSSIASQKESDSWSPDNGITVPWSGGIPLTAGSNYFIEAVHFQGGGGDNVGAYFSTTDGVFPGGPGDGTPSDFGGTNIYMLAPPATLAITTNPASVTVTSGTSATFTAAATTTTGIYAGGQTNSFLWYQWYTNGAAVPGATSATYTTQLLPTNMNNAQVVCAITAIGAGTSNTTAAVLHINQDTVPPTVVSALATLDAGGLNSSTNQLLEVIFSKPMDESTVTNPANYAVSGNTVTGVILFTNYLGANFNGEMVELVLGSIIKGPVSLTINNVSDVSSIAVSSVPINVTLDPLTSIDISSAGVEVPGSTFYFGPGHYEVDASGIDIWNTQDSFRFVYETKTNNFDIVVQVPVLDPADQWTKAGLMVREFIDPTDGGSRMMYVAATASTTLSPAPLDGSTAQNAYSMGVRNESEAGAYQPPTTPVYGSYFVGDGKIPVPYPNVWVRLARTGFGTTNDVFTGYYSTNGSDWTAYCDWESQNDTNNTDPAYVPTPFPSVVYVGLCTTAHTASPGTDIATAVYQNFGDFVAGTGPTTGPTVKASISGGNISISWAPAGGSLYSSPILSSNPADWTLVGTTNPYSAPLGNGSLFFKVIQ